MRELISRLFSAKIRPGEDKRTRYERICHTWFAEAVDIYRKTGIAPFKVNIRNPGEVETQVDIDFVLPEESESCKNCPLRDQKENTCGVFGQDCFEGWVRNTKGDES